MNLKEVAKRMDKKKSYRWGCSPFGAYTLFGAETGRTIYQTHEHLTAEIVSKKLRGMGFNIVGDVPAYQDLRD